jgi:hypothetical protein
MRLLAIEDLSGTYVYGEEDKSRAIDVSMTVLFVNMDRSAPTFLNGTAGKWLRANLDRPGVPYTIVENSISLKPEENPVSEGKGGSADPGSTTTPDASGATQTAAANTDSTQAAPATGSGTAPTEGQGGRRRRRQGEGFGSESGSGLSKGIGSAASEPIATDPTEDPASAKPVERAQEEVKQSGDLEQVAPLEPRGPLFGPKATVYKAAIKFRVKMRDASAQPASGGATP